MNDTDTRRSDMMRRVREFAANNPSLFPEGSLAAEQLAVLGLAFDEIQKLAIEEASGSTTATQQKVSKAQARRALREDLRIIARTARTIALDDRGFDAKFRVPTDATDPQLLETARRFAADAAPHQAAFVRYAVQEDFLADLEREISDFETALTAQEQGQSTKTTAGTGLDAAVERGMGAVQRLDTYMENKLREDAPLLAAWRQASLVQRPRKAAAAATEPPPAV